MNKPALKTQKLRIILFLLFFVFASNISAQNLSKSIKNNMQQAVLKSSSIATFTTESREPHICYVQTFLDKDGRVVENVDMNDTIMIQVMIANKPKYKEDWRTLESADRVEITMSFDKSLAYEGSSTSMKNIGESSYTAQTDAQNDDKVDFLSDTNTSRWRVGIGADATQGGNIAPRSLKSHENEVYIRFKAKILSTRDLAINNRYSASYYSDKLDLYFGDDEPIPIGQCEKRDYSLSVGALGNFNVVNQNFNKNRSMDVNSSNLALYTQVVGQPFSVKVLSSDEDDKTKLTPYLVPNDLILELVAYHAANQNINNESCGGVGTKVDSFRFSDKDSDKDGVIVVNVPAIKSAHQYLGFRVRYKIGQDEKCSYATDKFSVRPASYSMGIKDVFTPYIGGKNYQFETNATYMGGENNPATSYTTSAYVERVVKTDYKVGCSVVDNYPVDLIGFGDGQNVDLIGVKNIGKYKIATQDSRWTAIDQNRTYNGSIYHDCIADSNATSHINGKVGCIIKSEQKFTFIPFAFRAYLSLQNFNIGNFTYVADNNPQNMMATLKPTFEAILDDATPGNIWDNPIATAYDANCYAHDIEYDLAINNIPTPRWTKATTSQNDVHYDDNLDITTAIQASTPKNTNPIAVRTTANSFIQGRTSPTLTFNFDRAINIPHNPIVINNNDFQITRVIDRVDNAVGIESTPAYTPAVNYGGVTALMTPNEAVNFYYGRAWCPDVKGGGSINTSNFYEVFCGVGCNPIVFGLGSVNPFSNDWYLNSAHRGEALPTDGTLTMASIAAGGKNTNIARDTATPTIIAGKETNITLTANTDNTTYTNTIQLKPSYWLLYNRTNPEAITNDCVVTYYGNSQWSGQGQLGRVFDDSDNLKRSNRRVEW